MSDSPSSDGPAEFEASLEALETLVARMENGELGLEQSLAEFQRGMELVQRCQHALDDAQRRVEALTQEDPATLPGKPTTPPGQEDPNDGTNVPRAPGSNDSTDPDVPF